MRAEKTSIVDEIKKQLSGSPYLILMDFTGLTVDGFSELRSRLAKSNARAMVVKNSFMRLALKDLKLPDFNGGLQGPTAVVFGEKDVSTAARVIKNFFKEFKKPRIKSGMMDRAILTAEEIDAIADLPSREIMQAHLLGLLLSPATKLVRLLNTPAGQLVQVLKVKSEKAG